MIDATGNNMGKYTAALEANRNSMGSVNEGLEIFKLESTEGHRRGGRGGEGATGEIAWVPFGVGRSADGLHRRTGASMAAAGAAMRGMAREYAAGDSRDRGGTSLRGSSVVRWVGRTPTVPSGREWNGSQPGQGGLNFSAQGQRSGRCRVNRRAERVSRPAREKNRRRRVLVVAIRSPRPIRAVRGPGCGPSSGRPARRRWRRSGPRGDGSARRRT